MKQKYSIALIIPYFGKWPQWIDLFWYSCKQNSDIHFFVFTDCLDNMFSSKNITISYISYESYKDLVSSKLKISFTAPNPYKLCDLKPFLGYIHQDILKEFDFYGFCDLDLVFGNIREIIRDDILEKFEVISTHRDRVSGHFALFKNNAWNLNMPFKIKGWQSKLENHKRISVDERYLASVYIPFLERLILLKKLLKRIVGIEQVLRVNFFLLNIYKKSSFFKKKRLLFEEFYTTPFTPVPWIDGSIYNKQPSIWHYKDGRVNNTKDKELNFLYLHFMNFKDSKFRIDKVQLWQNGFYNINIDDFEKGVIINEFGIYPLLKK